MATDTTIWIIVAVVAAIAVLVVLVLLARKMRDRRHHVQAERMRVEIGEETQRVEKREAVTTSREDLDTRRERADALDPRSRTAEEMRSDASAQEQQRQ